MSADNPYAILFEPVQIGPVTAKNRFYQVPHCCGMGHLRPQAHAAMRGVKAEGGWAVVSTEETEIHPSSDLTPAAEQRLWDERDIAPLQLMTDAVHEHDSLAAIELAHNGFHASNLFSRIAPLAPSATSTHSINPLQAREMTKSDIRDLRRWHKRAVRHAKTAGFDIIYVYAGHHMSIAHHFLSPTLNQRTDEYGGSLKNRVRLTHELLDDALEEANGECAIAFRLAVDDMLGTQGMQAEEEGRAIVEMLAELPDLWDVNVAGWSNDSQTARFAPDQGYQDDYTRFVKQVTSKPVVGVGRYTSPDKMVSLIKQEHFDFIGAARPSIADPFLPNKIRNGRIDEICECIGCNICVASDNLCTPIRCTQNPTMGEEWRRGWHPQKHEVATSDDAVLVIGAGPAGLECANHLSIRGYDVTLAEARATLGGRVRYESALKGLASWIRVSDYREYALSQRANVNIYKDSHLSVDDVVELAIPQVIVATGARWRNDGVGRTSRQPVTHSHEQAVNVMTPDDIFAGKRPPTGPVVIYDDDQAYLASVIADELVDSHQDLSFVTPASVVAPWMDYTLEQARIQTSLLQSGVNIHTGRRLHRITDGSVEIACVYSDATTRLACTTLILVTERIPECALAQSLQARIEAGDAGVIIGVKTIGDAQSPGLIADAVFAGHLAARNFLKGTEETDAALFMREMPTLA